MIGAVERAGIGRTKELHEGKFEVQRFLAMEVIRIDGISMDTEYD